MNGFEFYSGLQYRVKAQARIIREFESGERYLKLEEKHKAAIRERDRIIRRLEKELAQARQETVRVRRLWFESTDDLEAAYEKKLAQKDRMIRGLQKDIVYRKGKERTRRDQRDAAGELRGDCCP